MLSNIESVDDLRGLARSKSRDYITKTVNLSLLEESLEQGWSIEKKNEKSVRLKKKKPCDVELANRVWFLLYRMGFIYLNGDGNTFVTADPKDPNSQTIPLDVVGIDTEVGLAIMCKSPENNQQLRQELDQYILIRQRFAQSVNQQFSQPFDRHVKRQVAMALFTFNILLSEDEKKRAREGNIVLFDENDLAYYEALVSHLGPAAKYQFLADMLPGKNIPGLNMRVPAIRARMGGFTYYTFSIPPEYLLKIAYVSHRSKGRGSDVSTYQRMIQKSRLQKIRKYIDEKGIFPTNIVINFDKKPNFDRGEQETEQESVKQSLLQELYADLHKNAIEPAIRVRSIVAQAILSLNDDLKSVFYHRIQTANETKDDIRCISLTSIFRALADTDFYIAGAKKEDIDGYGPLWSDNGYDATQKRTEYILNNWFGTIQAAAPEWWNTGAGEGGGLAMNDGVTACINVLRSVFHHLTTRGVNLVLLNNQELFEQVKPYAIVLSNYLGSLSEEDRKRFRALRGNQGQTRRTKLCQQAIHESIPLFDPPGLREFMETEKAQTNTKAKAVIDKIEKVLQATILEELRREFGPDDTQWWTEGIPKSIRTKVSLRSEGQYTELCVKSESGILKLALN
jgi:DNA-sulfur modification-associated